MPNQHSIEGQTSGIIVPLDLPDLQILTQCLHNDGSLEVHVIATSDREACPRCGSICRKIHDTRERVKRDSPLRTSQVQLVLHTRRFRCLECHRSFTEPDRVCGRYKRTTKRFREYLAQQAEQRPIAHVAHDAAVGPRFVQDCLRTRIEQTLSTQGRTLDETAPLPTPRSLGIDEFATRKGHRYDTILCDLDAHQVLEVSAGRKQEEVITLLERLTDPDAVEVVSMDMSASFRPAVQLTLPKAQIVVDHFHVIQHVMKAFKKVLASWAHKKESQALLQGKQSLFLKAREDLTAEQAQERQAIGSHIPALETVWQLKEALRTWYATATMATAAAELDSWIKRVQEEGPDALRKALSAFKNWRQEILAFFQFLPTRISNGEVSGKNNRTKALMRQA